MTPVLVDSNVLLDILTVDPKWFGWSSRALADAADSRRVVLNAIIYAEVSVRFSRIEDLENALPAAQLSRDAIPLEAAFLAAKAFVAYKRRGGGRRSTPPDFFIGAHAAVAGMSLLTRDPSRFGTYFPGVKVICP